MLDDNSDQVAHTDMSDDNSDQVTHTDILIDNSDPVAHTNTLINDLLLDDLPAMAAPLWLRICLNRNNPDVLTQYW